MMNQKMLVFGATGKAGRLAVERALQQGWSVTAFVRNPTKLSDELRSKVNVIKGDLCDATAVRDAVQTCRPDAIVDASSALPFGHAKGQPANNADRAVFTRATVEALQADGRLADCVFLIVGGQLLPEPGGSIKSWPIAAMAWVLKHIVARKMWREAESVVRWYFEGAPPAFRFIYARMGQMLETPSRGTLLAQTSHDNIQRGAASYIDVAEALVRLAGEEGRKWERKALYFNYAEP